MISLHIQGRAAVRAAISRLELTRVGGLLLEHFQMPGASFLLLLTDDQRISDLNRRFLGLSGPTNVLSFPESEASSVQDLGQICLSMETVLREARLYAQDPAEHFIRLLGHGILHLAGFDHGPLMQELTDQGVQVFQKLPEKHLLLLSPCTAMLSDPLA